MNAYELADQLDNVKYQNGAKPFEMYANMLRQQADRIAELEKDLHMIQRHYDQLNTQTKPLSDEEINLLKAEIAAHKKTNELLSQKIIELQEDNKK